MLVLAQVVVHVTPESWPALAIGSGGAVLGALVGGSITGYLTLRGERSRQQFTQEQEDRRDTKDAYREARQLAGIARFLQSKLQACQYTHEYALENGAWWPDGSLSVPQVSDHDLKLLAEALDPKPWDAVAGALHMVEISVLRRSTDLPKVDADGRFPPVDPQDQATLQSIVSLLKIAIVQLNAPAQLLDDSGENEVSTH